MSHKLQVQSARRESAVESAHLVLITVVMVLWGATCCAAADAQKSTAEKPPDPPEVESGGLVVSRATTRGTVEDGLARFETDLVVESYSDERQVVQLFDDSVAITEWSVEKPFWGEESHVRRAEDAVELVVGGDGKYEVSLSFVTRVHDEDGERRTRIPLVAALASRTELLIPEENLSVEVEPDISVQTESSGQQTRVVLYGGERTATVLWKPRAPEKVVKPVIFAEQSIGAYAGRGVLRVKSAIDYSIVQGDVGELELRLPRECRILNVKPDYSMLDSQEGRIRTWDTVESDDGKEQILRITLTGQIDGNYKLFVELERVLTDEANEVELPTVEPLNVTREKGQISVSTAKGMSVQASEMANVSHIDVRELEDSGAVHEGQIRLAFRYLRRPFTLKLKTSDVVAKISADVLTQVLAGTDSMHLTSNVNYTIRDAGVFELKVRLPDGLSLVDLQGSNINNWQMDEKERVLTISLSSKAEGDYALQIETELRDPGQPPFAVPAIHAVDVVRETGYIALVPAPGMKIESAKLSGISQIDVKELPKELLKDSPTLAYRYIRPDYEVSVNISEIQPEVEAEVRTIATLDEHALDMDTEIHYDIRRGGIFQLRVRIPAELRRTNVDGADIDDTSWDEEEGVLTVNLQNKVSDTYVLTLETEKSLEDIEKGVTMPVIQALDVEKERGFLGLVKKTSVRMKPATGQMAGLDEVSVSDLPPEMLQKAGDVSLAFKYFTQPWSLALAVERIKPRVTAEVFNLLSVGRKLLSVSATVDYRIVHAPQDTFTVKLPPGVSAVDIDGEGIKQREQDEESNAWTVTLQSKKEGSFTLYVSFEQELPKDQAIIPYDGVEVKNVQYQMGYIALTSRPDVELKVAPNDLQNLTPVDTREIPGHYLKGVRLPVLLSYRYVSFPYTLRVGTITHKAAEVTVAVVESGKLSTVITEEGNMVTDLVCQVRNSGQQQYLQLQLPEDASIWHAFVNGQSVTPVSDGDITKVNVARPGGRSGPLEVRLRYSERRDELERLGSLRLESPIQDIEIMRLGWMLSLPEGYDLVRSKGSLKQLASPQNMESTLRDLKTDLEVRARSGSSAQPRSSQTAQAMRNVLAQQKVQTEGAGAGVEAASFYTGSKPGQAATFAFQSLVVSGDEPAWLDVQYVKDSIGIPLEGLEVLLLLLICGLIWRWQGCPAAGRIAILFGFALVALAARTLAEEAYRDFLTAAVITFLVAAGGALIYSVATWVHARVNRLETADDGTV